MLQNHQNEPISFIYADDDQDDHESLRDAISQSFLRLNFKSVFDGEQLIKLLTKEENDIRPAFVVVDLNMPKVDGFAAIKHIKTKLKLDHLPVYALSTSRNPEDRQKAKLVGAAGFYTKPSRIAELKEIIEEMTMKAVVVQPR